MPDRQTLWGPRPTDWELLPWRSIAKRSGTPIVVDGHNGVQQVTVRVRHRGVVERRVDVFRRREILSPNQVQVRAGQFIISKIDARNGACGFVPSTLDGALVTTDFPVYDISADAADSRYLDHLVSLPVFWHLCESVSDGTTNRVRLNLDQFDALPFPIPPIDEQRRIAEVLDSVDAAIEKTEAVIAATERLRSALLSELLTRGVPGWHTQWKQVPGIGTIPACWDVVRLGEVAQVKNGTTPSKGRENFWGEAGTPFIRTGQVNDVVISRGEQFLTPEGVRAGAVIIPRGSVLVAMIGQGKTRGMAARLDIDAAVNQNFAAVVPSQRLVGEFFFAWARGHYDEIRSLGQGSNQGALNCGLVSSIRLPLPPKAEQETIVRLSRAVSDRLTVEFGILDAMRATKSATADALLSGRKRMRLSMGDSE